jgi:hypothetical protein
MFNLCLRLYPFFAISTVGLISSALVFYWSRRLERSGDEDRNLRMLVFLLIIAVLCMGAFLIYVFARQTGC